MDTKNKSDTLKTKEVYGNSGREMYKRSKSAMIPGYNDSHTTTLKSPVIFPPSIINSDSGSVSSGRKSGKKQSPYRIYDQEMKSPRIVTHLDGNSILPKLGERANNVPYNNFVYSPNISVRRIPSEEYIEPIRLLSPTDSYSSSCYSSVSKSEIFDYSNYYKPKRRNYFEDEQPKQMENATIKLFQEQIEKQSQMIDLLLERDKKRETPQRSGQRSTASASYTIPRSEPIKENLTPDYESMNEVEIAKYESRFRTLFAQLQLSYEIWGIEVPKIGQIPLRDVHEIYEEIVKTITIYQTAMKYKVALVVLFAGIEYVAYKRNKIKAFKNFTRLQIKTIHKYDCHLLSFSKSFSNGGGEEWPIWAKFLLTFATSVGSFASIQAIANSFGKNAPTDLLFEADKFISPTEGPVKLKHDGISEVPTPPEGLQDPNVVVRKVAGVLDFLDGVENPQDAIPVETKTQPKSDYDEVYE